MAEVENIVSKKLALVAASETPGVRRIVDRLKVTPAEEMADAEIRDHLCKLLNEEPPLERCLVHKSPPSGIETAPPAIADLAGSIIVEVKDGVVTLNGEVPNLTHKRLAGVLAWWVPGTCEVINGLEEVPSEEDNDDELIDAVRLVLEIDPFVHAADIRVSSKDWTVTLEGSVPSKAMKQMAERDAWYVLGLRKSSISYTSDREEQEDTTCRPTSFAVRSATRPSNKFGRSPSMTSGSKSK